jgi:uncharacterized membrane protein YgaE (UPF0421/DUF939 family)
MWPILQTGVAAVGAWYLAVVLGVEHRPAFASIAAVVSLGAAFGERRQRAVQLIAGVMLGIVLADLLVRAIGAGLPEIGLLVVLAMLSAVILGGGELLVSEAAVSAILVATVSSTPEVRLFDVLIGGGWPSPYTRSCFRRIPSWVSRAPLTTSLASWGPCCAMPRGC